LHDNIDMRHERVVDLDSVRSQDAPESDTDDVAVREIPVRKPRGASPEDDGSVAQYAGELIASLAIQTVRSSFLVGRAVVQRASDTRTGRLVADLASGVVDAVATDVGSDLQEAGKLAEEQLERVVSVVVPVVVQSVDPMVLIDHLDIDAMLASVDIDALIDRVDIDGILERVDIARILARIDIDELMGRVDLDSLLADVDIVELLNRFDVDKVLERVDIDALIERVDVAEIAKRANIGDLVAESTADVAGTVLDVGRRQAVGLDTLLSRLIDRTLGRTPDTMPTGPAGLVVEPVDEESS